MSITKLAPDPVAAADERDVAFLRLSSCPRCESRRRTLVEVGGRLLGRCLACGEDLTVPLAVETHRRVTLVGRAGQPSGRVALAG
jgi:hypothetical protein